MNNNDDEQQMPMSDNSGLGHDPLEWLQEDEDNEVLAVTEQQVESSLPEPEMSAAQDATAESDDPAAQEPEIEESFPQTEPEEVPEMQSPQQESSSEAQSFRFENHKAILTLPEKLTVQIIEPLHSEWKILLYDLPQSLEVDASKVKDIDAAGLQLFYALVQQIAFKGSDVAILKVEPSLQRHFKLFGLESFFEQYIHAA